MKIAAIINISILLLFLSCKKDKICKDQELEFGRSEYLGSEIQLNGFWYGPGREDFEGNITHALLCMYQNGVIYWVGAPEEHNFEEYLIFSNSPEVVTLSRKTKYIWGTFRVVGESIELAYWDARPCGYDAILKSGEILNDTTFILTKMETKTESEIKIEAINELFNFREFSQKPDSTNNFIR